MLLIQRSLTVKSLKRVRLDEINGFSLINQWFSNCGTRTISGYFIYAYELMLCLHVFRQTGPPRRVDCLAPPSVCHIKTEASR